MNDAVCGIISIEKLTGKEKEQLRMSGNSVRPSVVVQFKGGGTLQIASRRASELKLFETLKAHSVLLCCVLMVWSRVTCDVI